MAEAFEKTTLEPDGQAAGCKPVLVGSTPTGVSGGYANVRCGAMFFRQATGLVGPAARLPRLWKDGWFDVFRKGDRNRGEISSW